MRKKPTRKRPYFKMESAMTAILRDASGKMHHGILFDPPLYADLFSENYPRGSFLGQRQTTPTDDFPVDVIACRTKTSKALSNVLPLSDILSPFV